MSLHYDLDAVRANARNYQDTDCATPTARFSAGLDPALPNVALQPISNEIISDRLKSAHVV